MAPRRRWLLFGAPVAFLAAALAWYLASPLFVRPTLVEDSPLSLAAAAPSVATPAVVGAA